MNISNNSENFEVRVLESLDVLADRFSSLNAKVDKLDEDLRATNNTVAKWDGRLWTLCTSLIGTSFAAIFAAAGVVIFKALAG